MKRAGKGEAHQRAKKVTGQYFSEWKVERHFLVVTDNIDEWRLEVEQA